MLRPPARLLDLFNDIFHRKSIWLLPLGLIAFLATVGFSCAIGQRSSHLAFHADRKARIPAPGETAAVARAGIINCPPYCTSANNEVYLPTAFSVSQVVSGTVELRVDLIPPISGVRFSLDGRIFESDENGFARISVKSPGVYQIEPVPSEDEKRGYLANFERWEPDFYETSRKISVPETTNLVAGYELSYPVRFMFVDPSGQPVDSHRVSSVTLSSSQGATFTFQRGESVWLQKNRIVRRLGGLDDIDVTYTVQNVIIDGSNVVNKGQQRFKLDRSKTWEIELLLYDASFQSEDVLLGIPLGNEIELRYPDGKHHTFEFDSDHKVELDTLARGLYYVRVTDLPGISVFIPLALSRDQEITILVYSYLTIALVLAPLLLISILLPISSRPAVRKSLRKAAEFLFSADRIKKTARGDETTEDLGRSQGSQ